ncbi:MAG: hypothetical protein EPN68_06490 [Rhodanobacter sp.]|nr:MAG: hypothetical protein EPN68_06490 [Rhodanobacter sp.]
MTTSLFEAFNARDLKPEDVAGTFVPSTKYSDLSAPTHALLIGPRGSGKTTLLKMLSLEALRLWNHEQAEGYRGRIDFTGVFVPADITWGAMVDSLGGPDIPQDCKAQLGEAAFGINVLLAMTDVFSARLEQHKGHRTAGYRSVERPANLDELISTIAVNWRLAITSLSFRGISTALRQRLSDIYSGARRFSFQETKTPETLSRVIPYIDLDVFQAVEFALNEFDQAIGDKHGRWALLFDEFEVVPAHIQSLVLKKLRASSAKIIYKVALAPCGPQTNLAMTAMSQPSPKDDLARIELWYQNKNDALGFCKDLFLSKIAANPRLKNMTPEDVFGRSPFLEDKPAEVDLFDRGKSSVWASRWLRDFRELAKKDKSFVQYLEGKGIDPTKLNAKELDPSPRAHNGNAIRKIAPLVAFRNANRSESGTRRGGKPWRHPYTGWESLAAISEGNPRWLIGMIAGLESSMKNSHSTPVVRPTLQAAEVVKASVTFQEKLKAVAIENNSGITTHQSVFGLLEKIGREFERILITSDFSEDPPTLFEVDNDISEDEENCLRIALNFGGIVSEQRPDHVAGFSTLRSMQFRLAYILAPHFNLPLRSTGKSRALSTILKGSASRPKVKPRGEPADQGSLW